MKNENIYKIEDITIKDKDKSENNEQNFNNYNNQMDSLFKQLDFHIDQIKDLYNLEYKQKKMYKISKEININYAKNNNNQIKNFSYINTYRIINRIINDKNRNYKNNKHKRTQSSLDIKPDICFELKGIKKKPQFETVKFELFIKNENRQIKNKNNFFPSQSNDINININSNQTNYAPDIETNNETIITSNIYRNDFNYNDNNNNQFVYNINPYMNVNIPLNNNNIISFQNNNKYYNYNDQNNIYRNNNFTNNWFVVNNDNNKTINQNNIIMNNMQNKYINANNRYFSRDKYNNNLYNNKAYLKSQTIKSNNFLAFNQEQFDNNNFNNIENNNQIHNKLKNNIIIYKKEDKTIEEEPKDINAYNCLPFSQILNNCKKRDYTWELFPQEIAPNQLEQSGATCYMVSALESISHVPKLLNYIFDTNFSSTKKTFQINFKQSDGSSEHYIVKNNFPTDKIHNLKFMKPLEKEAYGIIFEKVWAVVRGGYGKLDWGCTYKVLNKVLGTDCQTLYNNNMGIFNIDINAYHYKMNNTFSNNIPKMSYEDLCKKVQEKQEGDKHWQQLIKQKSEDIKINPKTVFELIKNSQKNDGAIITTSINMSKNSGHVYSILGVYSKKNPYNNSTQDFIILKNPWRSGNDIEEKIDIIGIENQIKAFPEIIQINNKHYETGVFYMPKEYYEKWFRDIIICKPDYQRYFPEVFNAFNLYKEVANYYNINSQQYFFDVTQGQDLIKTDVISKQKYESLLKLIQHKKSEFTYAYDKNTLSTIWFDGKYMHSLSDSVFVKDNNSLMYNIKKCDQITRNEFDKTDVYKSSITFMNKGNKTLSVIKLTKVNKFEELIQKKNFNNVYNYPNINPLNADISKMVRFKNEIKEFLKEKYTFIETKDISYINDGWINAFPGINLVSDSYENEHYHVHNLGKNDKINLFKLINNDFKCSCYYVKNNKTVKYCDKYFTFKKKVFFSDFTYYVDGVKKTTPKGKCDYYNIEQEKINIKNN